MHSAVAQHIDMCKQPVILGDRTNLCLQAETDMITTDEGRHENGGSDTYYGMFPLVSDSTNLYTCLYTDNCNHSTLETVQVLSNNVGP